MRAFPKQAFTKIRNIGLSRVESSPVSALHSIIVHPVQIPLHYFSDRTSLKKDSFSHDIKHHIKSTNGLKHHISSTSPSNKQDQMSEQETFPLPDVNAFDHLLPNITLNAGQDASVERFKEFLRIPTLTSACNDPEVVRRVGML